MLDLDDAKAGDDVVEPAEWTVLAESAEMEDVADAERVRLGARRLFELVVVLALGLDTEGLVLRLAEVSARFLPDAASLFSFTVPISPDINMLARSYALPLTTIGLGVSGLGNPSRNTPPSGCRRSGVFSCLDCAARRTADSAASGSG